MKKLIFAAIAVVAMVVVLMTGCGSSEKQRVSDLTADLAAVVAEYNVPMQSDIVHRVWKTPATSDRTATISIRLKSGIETPALNLNRVEEFCKGISYLEPGDTLLFYRSSEGIIPVGIRFAD